MEQIESYIVVGVSFVLNFLAMLGAYLINYNFHPELISLFSGGILLSIALFHIFPASVEYMTPGFPIYPLISIISFTILTFFKFIRDALKVNETSILLPSDTITLQETFTGSDLSSSQPRPKFKFTDHFAEIYFFIIFVVQSFPYGVYLNYYSFWSAIVMIINRILEFLVLGRVLKKMETSNITYWILSIIACLIQPISTLVKIPEGKPVMNSLTGVFSSLLFGIYLFFASVYIEEGIKVSEDDMMLVITAFVVGVLIPALLRIGC